MTTSPNTPRNKVTQLHPPAVETVRTPAQAATGARTDAATYIAQMTLELERLAATANLDLLAYFLAMARAEAEAAACQKPSDDD